MEFVSYVILIKENYWLYLHSVQHGAVSLSNVSYQSRIYTSEAAQVSLGTEYRHMNEFDFAASGLRILSSQVVFKYARTGSGQYMNIFCTRLTEPRMSRVTSFSQRGTKGQLYFQFSLMMAMNSCC